MNRSKKVIIIVVFFLILIFFSNIMVFALSPKDINSNYNYDNTISSKNNMNVAIVITCIFGFFLYIIPLLIAWKRKHPQGFAIGCINIFLGWTLIGWIICVIWALGDTKTKNQNTNINSNKYEDLERLQNLRKNGTINEEEFKNEKEKILRR